MKIQIELIEDYGRTDRHLKIVANYIADKITYTKSGEFFGLTTYSANLNAIGGRIKGSDWGENIGTQDKKIFCHCSKTKGGTYKIKVWGE